MAKRRKPKPQSTPAGKKKLGRRSDAQIVDAPSRHVDAAMRSWQEGRFDEAFDLFRDAISREPNNVRAYVMAARAAAERCQYGRMEDILRKLVSRAPRQPGVHHSVGAVYGHVNLLARSIRSFEHSCRLPGTQPQTWLELASLYERTYRLDEAREMIERVARSDFNYPEFDLVRGRIHRRLKEFDQAESSYHDVIRQSADSIVASKAWGELALMWDRQGNYEGAVEAIGKCKEIQIAHAGPHTTASEHVHRRMERALEDITREHLQRWRDEVSHIPDRRVSLLTGFPRSGTTLLEQALDAHPDVISSEEHLFIGTEAAQVWAHPDMEVLDVLDAMRPKDIKRARGRYFEAMEYALDEPIGGRMHLDKNPGYDSSLPTQFRLFPETRLIVALRDPRDVVLSCYLRYLRLTDLSVRFLTPQSTAERYALDMRAWLKFREIIDVPWCEIRYEDTVADLECQVRRALGTLGLEWNDSVLEYRERLGPDKLVTSPNYEAVAEPIYTRAIGRWKNYAELLEPAFESLEPFIDEFGYDA